MQREIVDFVSALHLTDKQFGVAEDLEGRMLLTYRILQSRQQSGVFRVIIRPKPQVLTQFGKHLALAVTHYNAISSRPGIAAGATINVRDHGGLSRRAIFFKKRALLQW